MLHFAARREHVMRTIRPALAAGIWVVCDRFADSTLAYQGFGQGLPRGVWDSLASLTLDGLTPDLTLILDIPPEAGLRRANRRGDTNRYEGMALTTHQRIREGFLAIAKADPQRCTIIDATQPEDTVAQAILHAVTPGDAVPRNPLPGATGTWTGIS
jgi:dTMP kinase